MSQGDTAKRVIEALNLHYEEKRMEGFKDGFKSRDEEMKKLAEEVRTLRATLDHKMRYWEWNPALFGVCVTTNAPRTASGYRVEAENKPLAFDVPITPCTSELEVKLQKLAAYFKKRAKENTKRAEKLDYEVRNTFMRPGESVQKNNSAYFFSGKVDSYENAARKIMELLGDTQRYNALAVPAKPEQWVVEVKLSACNKWIRSSNCYKVYGTKEEAEQAIVRNGNNGLKYRVTKEKL